jgi:uncharacterized glyoxalase superfamily protein PhnB
MNPLYKTYKPEGFTTLNTYLFTENPQELIDWLKLVFQATELSRVLSDDGLIIRNCILNIGDTSFMIAQASDEFMGMRTAFYLYVNDVDMLFKSAVDNGGKIVFAPEDMDYGDRQGGIVDPAGNYWWISKRLETGAY